MKVWIAAMFMLAMLVPASAQEGKRTFVNTLVTLFEHESRNPELMREYVDLTKSHGFNALSTDIHWSIEREDGTYDFAVFDRIAEYALSQGLDLFVRVNTDMSWGRKPYWIGDRHIMCLKSGEPYIRPGHGTGVPSISHPEVLQRMRRFHTAVAEHCRKKFGSGNVVCFTASFSLHAESEYMEGLDYSGHAKEDFGTWCRMHYASPAELNEKWGTEYGSWEEIGLVNAHPTAQHKFFEAMLSRFFRMMRDALLEGDPKARYGMQTGCLWDHAPNRRTTRSARFFDHVDWLFVADAPVYPHAFTCDHLRGVAQDWVRVSNEMDGGGLEMLTPERMWNQAKTTWDHGIDTFFACNWSLNCLRGPKAPMLLKIGELAKEPPVKIRADRAIYMSSWDLIHHGWGSVDPYREFHDRLPDKDRRPVDVIDDSAIERDPRILERYGEIHLPANRAIPVTCRTALLGVKDRLRIEDPSVAGTIDDYRRPTKPLAEELRPNR